MAKKIEKILLPKELGADEVLSLAVLYNYGKKVFTGLSKAELEFRASLPKSKGLDFYIKKGIIPLFLLSDSYKSVLEELTMYEELELDNYPIVNQMVAMLKNCGCKSCFQREIFTWIYLMEINKDPQKVLKLILPLLKEYLEQAEKRRVHLFEECQKALDKGKLTSFSIHQEKKKIKVVFTNCDQDVDVVDDVATYLLYKKEVLADVVVLFTNKGEISIITKPEKNIDLLDVIAILRIETARYKKIPFDLINKHVLNRSGIMEGIEYWNFDLHQRRIDSIKSVNLDKLIVKKALLIGLDLERLAKECPSQVGCKGKKCSYYSYNMLRCRKRRVGLVNKERNYPVKKEFKKNIRVVRK